MKGSFETWEDFRKTLNITPEEEAVIQLEKELIEATIKAREEAKMSQRDLAEKAGMKQSAIARIEKMKVSPSVDTLNHLLFQLGYRLKIVPLSKK
ncbi:MAG: helix-turn-helix transcriptional regulator [Clostridia bacterium]|nr:helix-turn-helix transcriptional regulator [Clostridia bacterium]